MKLEMKISTANGSPNLWKHSRSILNNHTFEVLSGEIYIYYTHTHTPAHHGIFTNLLAPKPADNKIKRNHTPTGKSYTQGIYNEMWLYNP